MMRTNASLQYRRGSYSRIISWLPCSWLTNVRTHFSTLHKKTDLLILHNTSISSSFSTLPYLVKFRNKPPSSSVALRFLNSKLSNQSDKESGKEEDNDSNNPFGNENSKEEEESSEEWEEEDEGKPEYGDGGDGGGVVFRGVPWGERVLSVANEVLLQFGDDFKLFAFKTSPGGYIYARLDKLSEQYGCPSIEEMENYSRLYTKRLEEISQCGEIPANLALEVSSPGAERLLYVPDDLNRFKDLPMRVSYVEEENKKPVKDGVFFLESVETESEECVWRLADVKASRDMLGKGRPFSRKQKDWRLQVSFKMLKKVMLYVDY
ncbi:hypothetical protein MKX01_008578 [Papaver californicum]|nr:hypothetical protein MKX01_008578 [Papaver californicum]